MYKYSILRGMAMAVAVFAVTSTSVAQRSAAMEKGASAGARYISVSSDSPDGLTPLSKAVAMTKDRAVFVEGLKRHNTAILRTGASDDADDVARDWRAALGGDFEVSVLPDHYARLLAPREQSLGQERAEAVRRVREAFPQSRLLAVTVSDSDAIANYLLRESAEAGDLPPGPAHTDPAPSIVIPVNGVEYRVRAETFNRDARLVTGVVRDPSDRVVGYASISLASKSPGLKLSIGSNDYFSVPLDPAGDAAAPPPADGTALLVESPSAAFADHDGDGPSASVDAAATAPAVAGASPPAGDVAVPPAVPSNVVRLVVGYTPAARKVIERVPGSIGQTIVGAVTFSNAVFLKQRIPVQFDVDASRIAEVPYVERTTLEAGGERPIAFDLAALQARVGQLAALESLRVSTQADVVLLVEVVAPTAAGAVSCGEAAAIEAGTLADAHAIVNAGCLDSMVSYSLTHELGHLLGARHDRTSLTSAAASQTHQAYGYINHSVANGGIWRDVMSLWPGCPGGTNCARIPHFSDAQCQGVSPFGVCYVAGTANENAVALMRRRAPVLATVYERSLAPAPASP